jgi:hypothetical protein
MRKMLFLALLAFGINSDYSSAQVPPSLINAKKAINTALKLADADPMLIITVRRIGKTQLISRGALTKVLEFLNDACLGLASKVPQIAGFCKTHLPGAHSKLIIFSEMFFSRASPLDSAIKQRIFNEITKLSASFPHTVFFANFLFKETRDTTCNELRKDFLKMKTLKEKTVRGVGFYEMHIEDSAYRSCEGMIVSLPKSNDSIKYDYLINKTYCIWNKTPIAEYKKSTYCMESDSDIGKGLLYEFGDGITHKLIEDPVSESIFRNTIIEICYDLFCGIRQSKAWKYDGTHNIDNIHVIQSHTINPYDDGTHNASRPFDDNIKRLPLNTGIIHSDPYSYSKPPATLPYESLFFVENKGSLVVNNIQCTKQAFDATIDSDKYTITFYVIR